MLQLKKAVAISVLFRLAGALPGPLSHIAASLQGRDLPTGVPSCKGNDPSFTGGTSKWLAYDGQGYYAGSDCNDGGKGVDHCWTDYFLIAAETVYDDWTRSDSIDCRLTQTCAHAVATQEQSCSKFGWTVSATIATNIKAGVGGFELADTYTISAAVNGEVTQCEQTTNTDTCTWNDMECHSIWQAPMMVRIQGYLRRSCNTARDGTNVPKESQQAHRGDQYFTVGMSDFYFDLPSTSSTLGCGAFCNQTTYPEPVPQSSDPQWYNGPPSFKA